MLRYLLLAFMCTLSLAAFAQTRSEHIVVTTDGRVYRGEIRHMITPGGTVTLTPDSGRSTAIYWSEIASVRRLPRGIPDSVILGSFDHKQETDKAGKPVTIVEPPPKAKQFDFKGCEGQEDVVFLVDGSLLRGQLINERSSGIISFWTDGTWKEIGGPAAITSARVAKGIPDTTLINTYVTTPESWREGETRLLTLRVGYSFPGGELQQPTDDAGMPVKSGYMAGIDVGGRIIPGLRWLTSATYSHHAREISQTIVNLNGASASSMDVFHILAGVEGRSSGPSWLHARCAAQLGLLILNAPGFEATIPQTFYHLPGTITVSPLSSSSLELALTGGLVFGRCSLDLHWSYSRPEDNTETVIKYIYTDPFTVENTSSASSMFFALSLGFSVL